MHSLLFSGTRFNFSLRKPSFLYSRGPVSEWGKLKNSRKNQTKKQNPINPSKQKPHSSEVTSSYKVRCMEEAGQEGCFAHCCSSCWWTPTVSLMWHSVCLFWKGPLSIREEGRGPGQVKALTVSLAAFKDGVQVSESLEAIVWTLTPS